MGCCSSSEYPISCLIVGLDNAGKTTLLSRVAGKYNPSKAEIPTIGYNKENLKLVGTNFLIMDVGGQDNIRDFWSYYYKQTQAVIFVIDASDEERLDPDGSKGNVKKVLEKITSEVELLDCPLCICANKIDIKDAVDAKTIKEDLGLDKLIQHREWTILETSGKSDIGIVDVFTWIRDAVRKVKANNKLKDDKKKKKKR